MGNIIAPSNIRLPEPPPSLQPSPQKKSIQKAVSGLCASIAQAAKTPFTYIKYWSSPAPSTQPTLKRIDEAATKGLLQAKAQNVPLEPVGLKLHGAIDQALERQSQAEIKEGEKAAQKERVADLSPLLPDPEITDPPLLQDRIEDPEYWQIRAQDARKALEVKVRAFSVFAVLCFHLGKTYNKALVERATAGENPPSIWQVFTENYNLTFFEKIHAGLIYLVYYKTSLLDKVNEKYAFKSLIDPLISDLTKQNSEKRTYITRCFIGNVNEFLLADIQATKDFAYQRRDGNLERYQNEAVERHYNFSLEGLCRGFSERLVENHSPKIPIFKELQRIPIFGWFIKQFETFVNRFIIQRAMKAFILPNVVKEGVNKGLQATHPDNYPFATNLTRFFIRQLEQFRVELEKDTPPKEKATEVVPGTELLSPTIKNLMLALELQGLDTPVELRKKFEQLESDSLLSIARNAPDRIITENIEKGIIEGTEILFRHLNKIAQTGELSAQILELSLAAFSASDKDQALLEAEYREEKLKLDRTVQSVLRKMINKTVTEKTEELIYGPKTESSQDIASKAFNAQRVVAASTIESLGEICERMNQKVERLAENPLAEDNNIQGDIGSVLQIMQALASRKELQKELTNIKGIDRNAIWEVLNPLFSRVEKILEHVLKLQELQNKYTAEAEVYLSLEEIREFLTDLRDPLQAHPRHHQNSIQEFIREPAEKIKRRLLASAPLYVELNRHTEEISTLSRRIAKEQQALYAIQRLSPPRDPRSVEEVDGLLDLLLKYQEGRHAKGFRPSECLAQIKDCLSYFSQEEREELERIIGNGSNLRAKWEPLSQILQRIYAKHSALKNQDVEPLDSALNATQQWLDNKLLRYKLLKDKHHEQMDTEMRRISTEMTLLQQGTENAKLNLSSSLPSSLFTALCVGVPAVCVVSGASLGGGWGAMGLSWLFSGAAKVFKGIKKQESPSGWLSKAKKIGAATLGLAYGKEMIATETLLVAGAAYLGWKTPKPVIQLGESYIQNKAWKMFTNAYKFILQPRIYKAAVTRTMKELS